MKINNEIVKYYCRIISDFEGENNFCFIKRADFSQN